MRARLWCAFAWGIVCACAVASAQPLQDLWELSKVGRNDTDRAVNHLLARKVWWLMWAGSTAPDAPPTKQMCVRVTVTATERTCLCVINTFNHTVHEVKIYKLVGLDKDNNTELYTLAPAHGRYGVPMNTGHLTAASVIKGAACWIKGTRRLWPFHYMVWTMDLNTDGVKQTKPWEKHKNYNYAYLVGINTRKPMPEYHTAFLAPYNPQEFLDYTFIVHWENFHRHFNTPFLPIPVPTCYYVAKP